jgi:hypothetical protein
MIMELMKNGSKENLMLVWHFEFHKREATIFFEIEANIQLLTQLSFQNHIVYARLGIS